MNMAFRASIMICFWKTNVSVSFSYPYKRKSLEQAISHTHSIHPEHNKRMHFRSISTKTLGNSFEHVSFSSLKVQRKSQKGNMQRRSAGKKHEVHLYIFQILQTKHKGEFLWLHVKAVMITFPNVYHSSIPGTFKCLGRENK